MTKAQIRKEAINILAVAASEWSRSSQDRALYDASTLPVAEALGLSREAQLIAFKAWSEAYGRGDTRHTSVSEQYAEAECMLREGWTPLEPRD